MPAITPALVEPLIEPDWDKRGALIGTLADERRSGSLPRPLTASFGIQPPPRCRSRSPTTFRAAESGLGSSNSSRGAARNGIERFVAQVLPENVLMLRVFMDAGFDVARRLDQGVLELEFSLIPTEAFRARVDERDHTAVVASLRSFFEPEGVAVLGASPRPGSIGGQLVRNIVAGGFAGTVFPVNREGRQVAGIDGYESLEQIPGPIDLVVVCLPSGLVLEGCEAALRHGTKALCVISAGFAEVGSEGAVLQDRLLALVRSHGARLIWTELSLGVASASASLNATFAPQAFPPGSIGF